MMTKKDALSYAINAINVSCDAEPDKEAIQVLQKMIDQLSKPRKTSEDTKARAKAKRANERAILMAQVLPVLRDVITTDMTAKAIFTAASDRLPQDFTDKKVQYILLNEMKDEVVKTEAKGKPNTYRLK